MADVQALDGLEVDDSVLRIGDLRPGLYAEQSHFKLYLESGGRLSDSPILHGLSSLGRASQHIPGWIDGFYGGVLVVDDERRALSDLGVESTLFKSIGGIIVPGGWLGLAYETFGEDTPLLLETRRLLDLGAPPVVTPIGLLLYEAGCGLHIRNWYISEGWREGPRKLQGYRPVDEDSWQARAAETANELRQFLAEPDPTEEFVPALQRAARVLESLE